ncbi:oxidoreductase [Ruegeria atlantica]|uniref:oxidoreductase n=1 Tax=Ruegeria atlantica TaxID=81569 RepID=UPI00148124F0|nr:oxidoreductase [Ruegeria atlantica]
MAQEDQNAKATLGQSLTLPCGGQLKNRLVKSAMSDSLGDGEGNATNAQIRLYERWAEGGAALSVIGEVQATPLFPEKPGNLVLAPDADLEALSKLASRGSANGAQIWPQLGHAGALSHRPISRPKGPSPLSVEGLKCEGMTVADIEELPGTFAQAAILAQEAGFGGVQLHAGHGFLFSQFLSPLFNQRKDNYGGSVANRFRVIGETIDSVRRAVGPAFPVGIRINATDKLVGGLTEEEALEVVELLAKASIDLIDVSGGTYFPGAPSSSEGTSSSSGPYFLDFARRAKAITTIPIMLTGGFKNRKEAVSAIETGAADAVGLARSMALNPSLAKTWLGGTGIDPDFPRFETTTPGGVTAWYSMRLTAIGGDAEADFEKSLEEALADYEKRDAERCVRWQKRFT